MAHDAILYNLLIIGEAIKALPMEIKAKGSDVPWSAITGLRNILAHEYFDVDVELIHRTLDESLRRLKFASEELLEANGVVE